MIVSRRKLEDKCKMIESENASLRRTQVELESELVGARLDSKYLDKELAGRIQQIQILLASGTSQVDTKNHEGFAFHFRLTFYFYL